MVTPTPMDGIKDIWRTVWVLTSGDCYHEVRYTIDRNIINHIRTGTVVMNVQYIMEELAW